MEGSKVLGLAWCRNDCGRLLEKHGYLVLFDSTHSTNCRNWKLSTICFRDATGIWLPGAHIIMAKETADIIRDGLKLFRRMLPRWEPRYFVVDDSATECQGIEAAFSDRGAQRLDISLCIWHLQKNLNSRVSIVPVRRKLYDAMYAKTKTRCDILIQEAQMLCIGPYGEVQRKYIDKKWSVSNSHLWSFWKG